VTGLACTVAASPEKRIVAREIRVSLKVLERASEQPTYDLKARV
jgi:hypothetical protein